MICPKCKYEFDDEIAEFCPNCGFDLSEDPEMYQLDDDDIYDEDDEDVFNNEDEDGYGY